MSRKRILAYILDSMVLILLVAFLTGPIQANDKKVSEEFKNYSEKIVNLTAEYIKNSSSNDAKKLLELENRIKNLSEKTKKDQYKHRYSLYFLSQKVIILLLTIVYFVIFPLFNDGQTLFKKIFKIKVEYQNLTSFLLREELARNFICTSFILYLLSGINYSLFSLYIKYVTPITLSFMLINLLVFIVKKKAIHDIISKTNVVEV